MAEFARGALSYVGVGIQGAAIGTGVAATKFQTITGCNIKVDKPNRGWVPAFRKNLGYQVTRKGKSSTTGSITGIMMPGTEYSNSLMWALVFGNNNTVSGSATIGYTHVFNEPAAAANYPVYGATFEGLKGSYDNTLLWDFIGCFVKTLNIDIPEDGVITFTNDIIGVKEETGGVISVPTYTSLLPYESSMAQVQIGTTLAGVADMEYVSAKLTIDTGVEMKMEGKTSVPTARTFATNGMKVSGEINLNLKADLTYYNYFKNDTEVAFKIIITHTTLAGASSGYHTIQLEIPRAIIMGDAPEVSDEGVIPYTLKFEAGRHISDGYTIKATIINDEAGTYTV